MYKHQPYLTSLPYIPQYHWMNYTGLFLLYIMGSMNRYESPNRICGAAGTETSDPVPRFLDLHVHLHENPEGRIIRIVLG